MSRGLSLAPCGLVIERVDADADRLLIVARPTAKTGACPSCGGVSARIHSRYVRSLSDLPSQGRLVRISLWTRRFRCVVAECSQRIFTERLEATAPAHSHAGRRGWRELSIISDWPSAAGQDKVLRGAFSCRSARTPCCVLSGGMRRRRRRCRAWSASMTGRLSAVSATARSSVDLERRRIIDLLPDREAATVAAWLAARPSIGVIARDRGAGYIQAATDGRPEAIQVADRWHLMENASAAFLTAVQRSMQAVRKAVGIDVVDPMVLSCAERRQHSGWLRREEENAAILALAKQGVAIKEIVRRNQQVAWACPPGGARRPHGRFPQPAVLARSFPEAARCGLGKWLPERCRAVASSESCGFCRQTSRGHRMGDPTAERRSMAPRADARKRKIPSARGIARMMTIERDALSKTVARTMAIIEEAVPALVMARDLMDRFHAMIQRHMSTDLEPWISDAAPGLLGSFVKGIVQDRAGVHAALTQPWSNGQTEGQNTKLKLVKRQMYGRAKLDLLRARLLGAT